MHNKIMQIIPTLNVKRTLNIRCYSLQNQEKCPTHDYVYFEHIFRK